jgi:hypothetical protein
MFYRHFRRSRRHPKRSKTIQSGAKLGRFPSELRVNPAHRGGVVSRRPDLRPQRTEVLLHLDERAELEPCRHVRIGDIAPAAQK